MADEIEKDNGYKAEDKKEGKISGFFKSVGKKFNDATYELRMQGEFDKTHPKYTVYTGAGALSASPDVYVEEHLAEGYLIAPFDRKVEAGNLIRKDKDGKVLHIAAVEDTTLIFGFEDKNNDLPAKKIVLGAPAQKVEVIRVGDEYYLK